MDAQVNHTLASFQARHINTVFAENSEDACQEVLGLIPLDAVVGKEIRPPSDRWESRAC